MINVDAHSDFGQPLLQCWLQHRLRVILRNVKHLNNAAIENLSIPVPPWKSRSRSAQADSGKSFLKLSSADE
jgi:hypothetical protein